MELELVTIGTELLLGLTLDTNAAFLGQALAAAGVRITRCTSVPDEPEAVSAAVAEALARTRLVITSGGLGPTSDDLTKQAVASLFGQPLEFRPDLWEELVARFARMGRRLAEKNRCQAEVPRGAVVLPNPRGTAPGLWLSGAPGEAILLPGVPAELHGLVADAVVPRLRVRAGDRVVRSRTVRTTGIAESAVAERIAPVESRLPPLTLAFLAGLEGVDLRLTAWDHPPEAADRLLQRGTAAIRAQLDDHVYGEGDEDLAAVLLEACRKRGWSLTTAESCTGGLVGSRVTAIPGSSDVFLGGSVAYANQLKEQLGVPARILAERGAVSEETAAAMAEAARDRYGADLAAALTGIAGPGGGTADKPVGLVWFAIAGPNGTDTHSRVFPGSRTDVRARAAQFALWKLWRTVRAGA